MSTKLCQKRYLGGVNGALGDVQDEKDKMKADTCPGQGLTRAKVLGVRQNIRELFQDAKQDELGVAYQNPPDKGKVLASGTCTAQHAATVAHFDQKSVLTPNLCRCERLIPCPPASLASVCTISDDGLSNRPVCNAFQIEAQVHVALFRGQEYSSPFPLENFARRTAWRSSTTTAQTSTRQHRPRQKTKYTQHDRAPDCAFFSLSAVGAVGYLPDDGRREDGRVENCPSNRVSEHRKRHPEVGDVAI